MITDEQLIRLRDWALKLKDDAQYGLLLGKPGEIKSATLLSEVTKARERCAAIARLVLVDEK